MDDDDDPDDVLDEPMPADDTNADEELDRAAQGEGATAEDLGDGTGEIDAIGHAAGFEPADNKPFRGIDAVDRRDEHRWELDPESAEDLPHQ